MNPSKALWLVLEIPRHCSYWAWLQTLSGISGIWWHSFIPSSWKGTSPFQTNMHLYPCKRSRTFNTRIIIPLGIVYYNKNAGSQRDCGYSHSLHLPPPWVPSSKAPLHVNTASEAFVLAFLQQWLCGPVSLPLTNHPFQGEGNQSRATCLKKGQIFEEHICRDSGKNYSSLWGPGYGQPSAGKK